MRSKSVISTKGSNEPQKVFAYDVSWAFLGSVITLAVGFLIGIMVARWLGPTDLGLYSLTLTIYGLAVIVACFGIPAAVIKYAAEYKEDRNRLSQTTTSGLVGSVILGLIVAILLYTLSELLVNIFGEPALENLLKILAFVFPFATLHNLILGLLNGLRRMRLYAYLVATQSVLMALLITAFVVSGLGVEGAIAGLVFSLVGACFLDLFLARHYLHFNPKDLLRNVRRLLSFGGQITGASAVNQINYHADIILIGYFLMVADVGYYGIAIALSRFFWLIPQSIQRITYPATSGYWTKNNRSALNKMADKSIKYATCTLLPIGLIVGFFAVGIITIIYGEEYIPAVLPLWILLVGTVINGAIARPIGGTFAGMNRPDLAFKISALTAVINIALNVVLIPKFGIAGAAIATAVSLAIGAFIIIGLNMKMLSIRIDAKWLIRMAGITLLAVALFLLGKQLLNLYLVGGVILFIYLILVLKFFLTQEDRGLVKSLVCSLTPRRWSHE